MFKFDKSISTVKKAVSPHDCALLFGIPLTRECFQRKLEGPNDGNFAESFRSRSIELSWAGYEPVAQRLLQSAKLAESLGVRVFRKMHLNDIPRACELSSVTIISHWRSAQFKPADLVDIPRILSAVENRPHNPLASEPKLLADQLNVRLADHLPISEDGIGGQTRLQQAVIDRRQTLTAAAPEAFRGGAGVEFTDGFQDPASIAAYFPKPFAGVIDLTICNSLILAEMLRRRCADSLILATTDAVYPNSKLPFYDATIKLLAARPLAYEDAVEEIRKLLRRNFK